MSSHAISEEESRGRIKTVENEYKTKKQPGETAFSSVTINKGLKCYLLRIIGWE